jgi:hypothetical protein
MPLHYMYIFSHPVLPNRCCQSFIYLVVLIFFTSGLPTFQKERNFVSSWGALLAH